jgi:hypothetical protein
MRLWHYFLFLFWQEEAAAAKVKPQPVRACFRLERLVWHAFWAYARQNFITTTLVCPIRAEVIKCDAAVCVYCRRATMSTPATSKVDCIRAIRTYVDRMIKPKDKAAEVLGMKALLLDRETVRDCAHAACLFVLVICHCAFLAAAQKAIIGMVYSMHEILDKEGEAGCGKACARLIPCCNRCLRAVAVFLVESIDSDHSDMLHLKAIVFVRPSKDNLARLRHELREPKFAEYHLCALRASLRSLCTPAHGFAVCVCALLV